MSLSTALNTAHLSLLNIGRQTSVATSNITNAGNENYTRRSASLESLYPGARVVSINRHAAAELFNSSIRALSDSEAQQTLLGRIESLQSTLMGPDGQFSISQYLTDFHDSLQLYAASPSNDLLGEGAVNSAKDLVRRLNEASNSIQAARTGIDSEIAASVDRLNGLLADFEKANVEVIQKTHAGADASDALDQRDMLLKEISKIVPVSTITRENNDLVLMTGGATLFETTPRAVTFDPMSTFGPGTVGNTVRIDGLPVAPGAGSNTTARGSLGALIQLRDTVTVGMQGQLDEVARGLIEQFAERDPAGGGLPALAGLFTYPGGPALPPAGTVVTGLAQSITVNALFDPATGGNPALLRDGGANGAGYVQNTSGGASFSDRLINFSTLLDAPLTFDGVTGIGGDKSLLSFAADSASWLEGYRSEASNAASSKEALHVRLNSALVAETGVNLDAEMSRLLDLEHTFEASARLIRAVDEMLQDLFAAVR
ncbi:MAG: flagellar hook-associated protein FlgK [Rhizobiaceae bacterium]